ncbi:hypothetical protein D3C80_1550700 [compost metagenome]
MLDRVSFPADHRFYIFLLQIGDLLQGHIFNFIQYKGLSLYLWQFGKGIHKSLPEGFFKESQLRIITVIHQQNLFYIKGTILLFIGIIF